MHLRTRDCCAEEPARRAARFQLRMSRRSSRSTAPAATTVPTKRASWFWRNTKTCSRRGQRRRPAGLAKPTTAGLIQVLTGKAKPAMPPEDNEKPTADEVAILVAWINAGAKGPSGERPIPPSSWRRRSSPWAMCRKRLPPWRSRPTENRSPWPATTWWKSCRCRSARWCVPWVRTGAVSTP